MTDNEIIKALECCANIDIDSCNKCPIYPFSLNMTQEECMETAMSSALALINRQQAKYEDLQEQFRHLDIECERLEKANESQKAEIESLKTENEHFADLGKMYSEIKSEAYKEFAKRLKERGHGSLTCCTNWVDFDDIDNLVKEMTGELT